MPSDANPVSLQDLLASIEHAALREATLVAELSSGPVSRSWKLDSSIGPLVLRSDTPLAAQLELNREAEVAVLRAAARAGIGPDLVWADPERGLQVTRMLPGRIWTEADICESENLIRLGALFGRLHSIPVVHESPDLRLTLAIYAEAINTAKARSICSSGQALFNELSADGGYTVFSHRDPHCGNIVDNGELWLIDWEYAGSGDPCFDLAVVAQQHRLGSTRLDYLLQGYAGSAQAIDRQRLAQFYRLYDYVEALWLTMACRPSLQGK